MADVSTYVPQFPLPPDGYSYRDQIELRSSMRAALTGVVVAIADLDAQIGAAYPTELDDLTDVTLTALGNNEILFSSGGVFINQTLAEAGISAVGHTHAASDVTSGTFDSARISEASVTQHAAAVLAAGTLSQIGDVTITGPTSGDLIQWSGSAWVDKALSELGLLASVVGMAKIGSPALATVQRMQDLFHSSGKGTGGAITISGTADSVDIAAGEGWIRATNDQTAELKAFGWGGATLSVPDNTVRYVGVEYNAGSPQAVVRTSNTFNGQTDFYLATVVNDATNIHIIDNGAHVGDHAGQMIARLLGTNYIAYDRRVAGLALSETGTRNIALTPGRLWSGLEYFDISALDTSVTGNWKGYYYNGSNWIEATQTQWPNTQYNNTASGLATMTTNWYAHLYFYAAADDELFMVYGQNQYAQLGAAEAELPPTLLPDTVVYGALLIGRLTFQKSAGTATDIESYLGTAPSGSSALSDHGNLSGLADDDHTQYILVDATRDFTATPEVNGTAVSLVGHTHVEADITDLQAYLLNITGESIEDLSDVTTMTPNDNDVLTWNTAGGYWEAQPASSGALGGLTDVTITGPTTGDLIQWNGSAWVDVALSETNIADVTAAETISATWAFSAAAFTWDSAAHKVSTIAGNPAIETTASNLYFTVDSDAGGVGTIQFYAGATGVGGTLIAQISEASGLKWGGGAYIASSDSVALLAGPTFTGTVTFDSTQDITITPGAVPKIASTGYLQLDAGASGHLFTISSGTVGLWDATTLEVNTTSGVVIDATAALLEIQSAADAKIILRDDSTSAWNRIDFYELTDRHGYLGFGTANEFFIVNEESAGVVEVNTTGGGQFLFNDGGASDGRVATIASLTTSPTAPSSSAYPYGAIWGIYT